MQAHSPGRSKETVKMFFQKYRTVMNDFKKIKNTIAPLHSHIADMDMRICCRQECIIDLG
jgi:hypothetical protein